jgi:hypothetical protein
VSSGLLAFGFLNPVLLWGLGLAGVPVLIHLLSRRYVRRIEWGATRFLLIAERKTRRRVRFEQWLLVALRCIALALLALLVARPFVRPGLIAALLGGRGHVARVIVLDDSASESYRIGAAAEFDRLKDATGRLLSWLRQEAPHDPVTVCLTSGGGAPLVQDAVLSEADLADLRARIARLEPVETPAHPGRTIAALAERRLPANIAGADFYMLSDFQQTDWLGGGADGRSVFAPLRALGQVADQQGPGTNDSGQPSARPPDRSVRAVLIASGIQPRNNVALINAQLERPQTVAGFPAIAKAEVANYAIQTISDVVLQVEIDGAPLPATPVGAIEAGQHKTFSLEVTFPEEGTHVLTLTLGPVDSFRADDTYRQAVEVKPAVAVLLVNGAPGVDEYRDESFLLRSALAPPGPLSSGVRVETIDPEQVRATDLDRFDAVLLCNVPPPAEVAAGALNRYLRKGGGLAIFLGSEVGDPAEYNRALYAGRAGVLPAPLENLVSPAGEGGGVGLVRTQPHAVTAAFPAGSDTLSEYVHFWRYYRCAEADADGAGSANKQPAPVVLARYADQEGTGAIIERDIGRGRVLLFTSTADLEWNDWARAPDGSYVVTMLELVQYLARRTTEPASFVAGQQLSVSLSPEAYEPAAIFKSPAFPNEPPFAASTAAPADPEAPLVVPGPIAKRLGTYVVDLTPRAQSGLSAPATGRPLCVNLDPAESDLAVASPAALDAALAGIPHELVATADEFLQGAEHTRQELSPSLLVLLAITLMLEQFLAWWFGKPRTGSGLAAPGVTIGRGRRRFAGRLRRGRPGRVNAV